MTNPSTKSDEQKAPARAAARELMRAIWAWECFRDPQLAKLADGLEKTRRCLRTDDDGGAR